MADKIRLFTGVGLALVASLALTGCVSSTSGDDGDGRPTTNWRDVTSQEEVSPEDSKHVDAGDTSRQDGAREIKFITEKVETINSVTGKKSRVDQTTLFTIEVTSVTAGAKNTNAPVLQLAPDARGKLLPTPAKAENVDIYTISLAVDFVSGYEKSGSSNGMPLFWPVLANGNIASLVEGSVGVTTLSKETSSVTLTAAIPAGSKAPDGVRYIQYNGRGDLASPKLDIFIDQGASIKPSPAPIEETNEESD